MGFVIYGLPAITVLTLILCVMIGARFGGRGVGLALLCWPFIAIASFFLVEKALTVLCIDHVPHAASGYIERSTGYCPIDYYDWMDFP